MQVFFPCICMFLKQEKLEMDDFELKINFGSKGKIPRQISIFLTDILAKMSQNIFAYSFFSEHSKHVVKF